jgi:uncharacterized damage-inducible protein DinB
MAIVEAILQEFDQEAKTTRRVLERVPDDKLTWRPHPKSMSIGELALHVAAVPGVIIDWVPPPVTDLPGGARRPEPASVTEILTAHEQAVSKVKSTLTRIGDAGLQGTSEIKVDGATLMTVPKMGLVRSVVLNHWIHHRGQLSVYLRLLDVPVPSIYGPSADENPFAGARV